ncbi:aminotransferase [Brachybacterium endophyticum]|uniref:Aminotransferase n=1 Tax=Brachybacterium endophyticum TaxID=2182385 RepID=A0A2U2RN85_9MICO|nr:aminotransferase class I/II-fold pyridoxal phosphate-dependent enzyme [Brachybacterium endophyticum]PWH07332.1 aminotransferase [Brachybacterium endophyticum]
MSPLDPLADVPPDEHKDATSASLPEGPWSRAAAGAGLLAGGEVRPTIFARMSALAAEHGAMNLGQGFPDTDPPPAVAEAAVAAIREGANQYPPGAGIPALRESIAAHQKRFYGLDWDPSSEVLVTTGATEALAASLLALVRPGDEVLTLAPFYDAYGAVIALAGGVHRTVPIHRESGASGVVDLRVDPEELRAAITDRTRVVLLNSPHNPTGLVLERPVLQAVVDAAAEHDAYVLTDEVYEHLVFDGEHLPTATLPGARERTISVGSAGKTLSVTGWKVGWVTASAPLVDAITAVKQWLTYASGAPLQGAVAQGLAMADEDFTAITSDLEERRDLLVGALQEIGLPVIVPQAGYFVLADVSPLTSEDATELCDRLPAQVGVAAIPVSAFLPEGEDGPWRSWVRLAFCKDRDTIQEALRRLRTWTSAGPSPVPEG